MPAFQKQFEVPTSNGYQITASCQTALGNGSYIGVIIGLLLNGYISERIGMKKSMCAYIMITAFNFILVFCQTDALILVGQILCGIPWGVCSTQQPTYALEICPVVFSRPSDDFHQPHMGHWAVDLGRCISSRAGDRRVWLIVFLLLCSRSGEFHCSLN